jgi:hypothetical protein
MTRRQLREMLYFYEALPEYSPAPFAIIETQLGLTTL